MRRVLLPAALLVLGLMVPGCRVADDHADDHPKQPPKYKGEVHRHETDEHGKKRLIHEDKDFDLTKPADHEALVEHLRAGEVGHLVKDEPVNILALSWDLGLWTLVVFLLLFLILKWVAWKPMLEGLQKREENIRAAIDESRQARAEAAALRDEIARERAKMGEQIREAIDEARRDAQRLKDEFLAQGQAQVQADRDRLHRELETAKDQALQELLTQTSRLATLVAGRAIGRELNDGDHRRLVDEALAEMRQAGTEWQKQVASVRS